jgi:hypothetical protein
LVGKQLILSDMEDKKSWALHLLTQMCSSLRGMFMNTAAHFGVRRAKFLDSSIQERLDVRCLLRLVSAVAAKTPKGRPRAFHGSRKIGGV